MGETDETTKQTTTNQPETSNATRVTRDEYTRSNLNQPTNQQSENRRQLAESRDKEVLSDEPAASSALTSEDEAYYTKEALVNRPSKTLDVDETTATAKAETTNSTTDAAVIVVAKEP